MDAHTHALTHTQNQLLCMFHVQLPDCPEACHLRLFASEPIWQVINNADVLKQMPWSQEPLLHSILDI